MRRIAFICAATAALVVPALAAAGAVSTGDGSLVVRNGSAPDDTPVVQLNKFTGSVIGRVFGFGHIIIDAGPNCPADPQVIGAGRPQSVEQSATAQLWSGSDFTFRAIGGPGCTFAIVIYSSNDSGEGRVYLTAAGRGTVRLTGTPEMPSGDGRYSLNDADFKSLPGVQSAKLLIGDAS